MKRALLLALAATAAISVPVAAATPGNGPGGKDKPAGATHKPSKPSMPVSFILKGVVTGVGSPADTITIDFKGGNKFAKKAIKAGTTAPWSFVVLTGAKTKFSKAGKGASHATLLDIAVNDRVVVHLRAPRASTADDLAKLAAKKVTDQGPAPAPAP